jgi:hypothetical protein
MKKCKNCGAEVSDTAILCPVCDGFVDPVDNEKADEIIEKNVSVAQIQNLDSVAPDTYVKTIQPEFNKMEEEINQKDSNANSDTDTNTEKVPETTETPCDTKENISVDTDKNSDKIEEILKEIPPIKQPDTDFNPEQEPVKESVTENEKSTESELLKPIVNTTQPVENSNQTSTQTPQQTPNLNNTNTNTNNNNSNNENPYSAYLSPEKKKSKAPKIIIVVLAILAVAVLLIVAILFAFKNILNKNEDENILVQTTTVSEYAADISVTESESETETFIETEPETASDVVDYVENNNILNNVEDNNIDNNSMSYVLTDMVNKKYIGRISVSYTHETNTYTIKITNSDFSEKMAAIKASTATADSISQDIEDLCSNCNEFRNVLFAYGIDANIVCSMIDTDSSDTLLTVSNGEVTYNAATNE